MRRSYRAFATSLAALLLTLVVPAGPAFAAEARIVSPEANTTVGGQVLTVQINATRGTLEGAIQSVQVRLSMNGTDIAPGTQSANATCVTGCGSTNQTWALEFDPMTFAPFGTPSAGRCNGGWFLQTNVNNGGFGQGVVVVRSVAPSAPSGVSATGETEQASVRWTRSPEPDVVGYLVERRSGSGSWTTVANLGATADRYTDDDVSAGTWDYRVVSLRGDGRTSSNGAAAACADTGADLAAASQPATTQVQPKKTASGGTTTGGSTTGGSTTGGSTTGGDSGTDGTSTDGGDTDGTDGDTDGGTDSADGGENSADGSATDGGSEDGTTDSTTPIRRSRPRQAAPPPVDMDVLSGSLNVGTGPDPVVAQERYFGDGDEFSEEWDFGDAEAIAGEEFGSLTETRTIRVPGALQQILGEELDAMRLFGSVAAGLLLITLGAHLRRWMRAGQLD